MLLRRHREQKPVKSVKETVNNTVNNTVNTVENTEVKRTTKKK